MLKFKPRAIDSGRIKDTSLECLAKWFKDWETLIKAYKIVTEERHNMKEAIGDTIW